MTVSTVWDIITKIIDISIVWFMFYYLLKNLKNNVKLVLIFKGVAIIILIKINICIIVNNLHMYHIL